MGSVCNARQTSCVADFTAGEVGEKEWSGKPCLFSLKCVLMTINTSVFHSKIL